MKSLSLLTAALAVFCSAAIADGQGSPAATSAAPPRTEVYHVHFNHAAAGKASALADFLKTPGSNTPMPGHLFVLR
ncbi:MAG TPA: hypothetical protein VKM56_11870, partial [Verrucomicrobiae bacterium]|nr:hypothetical protein [Verrucomicrobiae bacterium]